jgi:hypothetical protein
MKKNVKYITIFILIYIFLILSNKGYILYYPSIPVYPNNYQELIEVKHKIKSRTQNDIDFFHKTNPTCGYVFSELVNESPQIIHNIGTSQTNLILFFKYSINRRRPWQIDSTIKPLDHKGTADTPAYPAGHALQAYYVAKILSKKYPDKKEKLYKLALKCDDCRVKAGLHYVSDGIFARQLVDYFFP